MKQRGTDLPWWVKVPAVNSSRGFRCWPVVPITGNGRGPRRPLSAPGPQVRAVLPSPPMPWWISCARSISSAIRRRYGQVSGGGGLASIDAGASPLSRPWSLIFAESSSSATRLP